jgi:hypothetical protein
MDNGVILALAGGGDIFIATSGEKGKLKAHI